MTTTKAGHIVDHREGLHAVRPELRCPVCRDLADGIHWCSRCGRRNKVVGWDTWHCKSCNRRHQREESSAKAPIPQTQLPLIGGEE